MGGGASRPKKVVTLVLNPESSKSSVSKIHLDKKLTWSGLRRTIDTVFPELSGQPVTVTWNSPDKRTCKVSSDEELIVAVESMGDKTEFNIKRLKTGDDQTDKTKNKDTAGRRVSIRDNPTVARIVKPIAKLFSQKEMKLPDPPNKSPEPTKKQPEEQKTKPDDKNKSKPDDKIKTKPDDKNKTKHDDKNKTKHDDKNKNTELNKKEPTKK